MKPRLGRQAQAILAAMLEGQTVSPMDAMRLCGSWRLAARCHDLRACGWNVQSERVSDGERVFATYRIDPDNPRTEDGQQSLFDEEPAS